MLTTCRIDFYQTPKDVHVSVFAKKSDQERSKVTFEDRQVCPQTWSGNKCLIDLGRQLHIDLFLPDSKRFKRSLNLYGKILPNESSYKFFGTKVCYSACRKPNWLPDKAPIGGDHIEESRQPQLEFTRANGSETYWV